MAPHAVFVYELWNELNILFNQDELHHVLLLPFRNHSANSQIWCQPFGGQSTIAVAACRSLSHPDTAGHCNGTFRSVLFLASQTVICDRSYVVLTYWAYKIGWCVRIILRIVLGRLLKNCVIRWL